MTVARQLPTGTVTFVFSDIEGSTRLIQQLGDTYRTVLERHHAIVETGRHVPTGGPDQSS
jgi:class 3 adenylate cyclase